MQPRFSSSKTARHATQCVDVIAGNIRLEYIVISKYKVFYAMLIKIKIGRIKNKNMILKLKV